MSIKLKLQPHLGASWLQRMMIPLVLSLLILHLTVRSWCPQNTVLAAQIVGALLSVSTLGLALTCPFFQKLLKASTQTLLTLADQGPITDLQLACQRFALDKHAIVAMTDTDGTITYANDRFCQVSGYARHELLGRNHNIINSNYHPKAFFEQMYDTIEHGELWKGEICNRAKDGSIYWVDTTIVPIDDGHGNVLQFVAICADITKRKLAEIAQRKRADEALRASEERYALAAQAANDGLWDWDLANDHIYYSPRWQQMIGYKNGEIASHPDEWFSRVHETDLPQFWADIQIISEQGAKHLRCEHRLKHRDGSYRWILCRGLVVHNNQGKAVRLVGSISDITEQKQAEHRLRHESLHDPLTDLPNRQLFRDRLEHCIKRLKRQKDYRFAVLFLDLDRFKVINDSLGHAIGDQLLKAVALKLKDALRDTDSVTSNRGTHTLARMGGDEFTILLEGIANQDNAVTVAERIQGLLSESCTFDGHEVTISVSVGVLISDEKYDCAEDMLRDADTAMYRAKVAGKASYALFDQAMHDQANVRLQLESQLRKALEHQQLVLHYQPLISLETGRLDGFEALVRWNHPDQGMVSPLQFIPIAEETGLILPIGQWVILEACRQLARWQLQFSSYLPLRMNINLSRKQLAQQANLIDSLTSVIEQTNVDPNSVHLEITESTIMQEAETASVTLEELKALGFRLDMDDFGTGYSSLSCLHHFPLTGLKIDRSFIGNMINRPEYTAVVHAIVTLAHNLSIKVTAEGVENAEQVAQLQTLECDFAQGFYFSKPMPPEQVEAFIKQTVTQAA